MALTLGDITKLITEQNELFAKQWRNQMQTLTKALEKLYQTPSLCEQHSATKILRRC